ncbi:MAG: isoprenylcysteine carboxylmethyltransferase family protein [Gammaproteobacteria bacterium]|nr:isoprenylcysteine carboxylmethyltransferase family protein [Gammaproteobacteria bacterium]
MLIIKGLLGGLFQIALFAVLLFLPAGTWYWPRAILFLAVYGLLLLVSTIVLARLAPASLEARLTAPIAKSQPMEDRVVTSLLFLSLFAWFVFIPIEVFHLQLLPPPHFTVSVFGAALFLTGFGIIMIALLQNAFAVPIVRFQPERGHVLIDTGIYGRIRHPMYFGLLLFLVGTALWLESYVSVLMLPLVFVFVIARIFVEEKTLQETLPGYVEYMARIRYRLIPFVW